MKSLILLLGILLTNLWAHATDKIINCNFMPGRCECQVMEQVPGFNNSPFAEILANGLSNIFGRHQAGPTQSYIDQLRSWRRIDAQMAQDVENFRQQRMNAQGKLSEGDKEILDYLNEMIKQSQDLSKESRLPKEERPTPLPNSVDADFIRKTYQDLYQSAAANRPVELEQGVRNLLKGLQAMKAEERAFHQTELARTFLRRDLTFKSLPYVKNPELNLKSEPSSRAGLAARGQINQLMALQSQALQRLHGHCELKGCADPNKLVQDVNHTSGQFYKNIELRDHLAGTFVEDKNFNKLSKDLFNEYSNGLSKVRNEEDFQSLKDGLNGRITELQERRLGLKSELLASNGGRYNLPESSKTQLASLAGELRSAATMPGMETNSQMLRDLAEGSLDLALGFIPIVSTAKDFFEMVSGTSLISGEKLDITARTILAAGVALDLATFGTGSLAIRALSKVDGLRSFLKGTGNFSFGEKVIDGAEKIIDSGRNLIDKIEPKKFTEVLKRPKGARPDPKSYLPTDYIESHLKQFDDGATRFMKKSQYEKYGPAQADGTAFVLPKREADKLLAKADGDKRAIEEALGYPKGTLDNEKLIRIDVSNPRQHNARLPSGNEPGANDLWVPGGKLPKGNSEAVLDLGNVSIDILKLTEIE